MKLQKDTEYSKSHGRWYDDACGMAFGLEVLGERWAMLIVRELLFGPRRFSDLRRGLPGISAKVLTERLEGLADWGVLERRILPPPAATQVYALTNWGQMVEPLIMEFGRWAARSACHDPTLPLSAASLMSSMKTMQIAARLEQLPDMALVMRIAGEPFVVAVKEGALSIRRGEIAAPDVTLYAPGAPTIAGALYANISIAQLETEAGLAVDGDRQALDAFLNCFALPPKTAIAAPAPRR